MTSQILGLVCYLLLVAVDLTQTFAILKLQRRLDALERRPSV